MVVQGTLEKGNRVLAHEVLAKHDENYTRRKWKRRCRKTTAARNALMGHLIMMHRAGHALLCWRSAWPLPVRLPAVGRGAR